MATLTYEEFLKACLEFIQIAQKIGDNWEAKGNTQEEGAFYLYKRMCFEFDCEENMALSSQKLPEKCEMIEKHVDEDFMQCEEQREPYNPSAVKECEKQLEPYDPSAVKECKEQLEPYDPLAIKGCEEQLELYDPSTVKKLIRKDYITYEYHIVYNFGHSVPTLYFNAWYSSGKLLTLEEIWKRVHFQFSKQIWENKWESLTQTEHPLLGRPFFQLHPCHTAKLMGQLKPKISSNSRLHSHYIISWLSMFGPVIGLKVSLDYFLE